MTCPRSGASPVPRIGPRNTAAHAMTSSTLTTEAVAQPHVLAQASPLVKGFLDYLKYEKHFSDYTVKSYGADLIQFAAFIAGEIGHANTAPVGAALTPEQIDERQLKCEPLTIREFL
ncbi:hypothetical protein EON77_20975, partial [bacterium]